MAIVVRGHAGTAGGSPADNAVVVSTTFNANPVAGDLIAVGVIGEPDAGSLNNDVITDNASNTYTAGTLLGSGGRKAKFYYKENCATVGSLVATATNSNLMLGHTIFAICASGVATSSSLDEQASSEQSAPGTAANAVSVSTGVATDTDGQLLFAISGNNAPIDTFSAGSTPAGQTKGDSTYPTSGCSGYRVQATAGTATMTFTVDDGSGNFITGLATFRAAGGGSTYTLTCTKQDYTLTGNATGLLAGRKLTADQQSYTLTGNATTLTYSNSGARTLVCDQQSYTLTGYDVTLAPQSPPAFYTLTGNDVALLASTRVMACDQQSYTLTGNATAFLTNRVMPCVQASYALSGPSTNLVYSNAPAGGGQGTNTVRRFLRPYLGVTRRPAAIL